MHVVLSIMLMQECCLYWPIHLSMGNGLGGVPLRIKHLLHSSAVRYGKIFHTDLLFHLSILHSRSHLVTDLSALTPESEKLHSAANPMSLSSTSKSAMNVPVGTFSTTSPTNVVMLN